MYKKYVLDPASKIPVSEREMLFRITGFNGCIGSNDATRIPILRYPQWASNTHKGFNLNFPARTYNVTVAHSRRIIHNKSSKDME